MTPRSVPHITLFGPYDTRRGYAVRDALQEILASYETVPYRIEGFGVFPENNVIYADVRPSDELRELRRTVSRELRPLCTDYRPHDQDYHYAFHITIAYRDVGSKFDDIYAYVTDEYDLQRDVYAKRVTNLDGREMLWEWDLPRGRVLTPDEATSANSWQATEQALRDSQSPDDHDGIGPVDCWTRLAGRLRSTLSPRW